MPSNYQKFLTYCACGNATSKKFARAHDGKCKSCAEGKPARATGETHEQRNARIIDSGYQAYAREEGHFDGPDY